MTLSMWPESQLQIVRGIVALGFLFVMDLFARQKHATKNLGHYVAVFQHVSVGPTHRP
jgi:hypothetical protein